MKRFFLLSCLVLSISCSEAKFSGEKPLNTKDSSEKQEADVVTESNAVEVPKIETPPPVIVTETGCLPGHKLYIGICKKAGVTHCNTLGNCDSFYSPLEAVCGSVVDPVNGQLWETLRPTLAICVQNRLTECSPDWRESGQRYCTLSSGIQGSTQIPQQPSVREVASTHLENNGQSVCPVEHTLFANECETKLNTNIKMNFIYAPDRDVCGKFCNSQGCHWQTPLSPTSGSQVPSYSICVEENLPECAPDWSQKAEMKCFVKTSP
jgi:hypothetical protein